MHKGQCYCGKVGWEINDCDAFAVYCHCESCRKSHAAPMYWVAYVPSDQVTIHGREWTKRAVPAHPLPAWKSPHFGRWFCTECGTRTFNTNYFPCARGSLPMGEVIGIFPSTLSTVPETFRATAHVHCTEAVIDLDALQDNLPRYPHSSWKPPAEDQK